MPAKAGIQYLERIGSFADARVYWVPAFAGTTLQMVWHGDLI